MEASHSFLAWVTRKSNILRFLNELSESELVTATMAITCLAGRVIVCREHWMLGVIMINAKN